ncbi:MAG: LysR family transcriptional regulator [Rhodoferax sp.]|nr:LysR family transcriptional regulator [Rhodoferax sp.]
MDSFDLIKTFSEVAAGGSFSGAAARLKMGKATVSKHVAELESRIGVRLLNRSTRAVSLTEAGALLLERLLPVIEIIKLTREELQERSSRPVGRIHIAAPHGMSQGRLPKLLAKFLGHYPEVSISLQLSNRTFDLAEEAIDVALLLGPVTDENLILRKLQRVKMTVCASPVYWRKHGLPEHPTALAKHTALTNSRLGPHPHWRFEDDGRPVDVAVKSRMDASEAGPLIEAAIQGFGVLYLPNLLVQSHLEHGELLEVLPAFARNDIWLSAAYLQRRHNSAALRALLDFLQDQMGDGKTDRK